MSKTPKIVMMPVDQIQPAKYNPRKWTAKEEKEIRDSLTKFGFVDPLVVNMNPDRRGVLIGGHLRLKVWTAMGNDHVPVVQVNLNERQEKELNLRLNRGGAFDIRKVAELLPQSDLIDIGFAESDFAALPCMD